MKKAAILGFAKTNGRATGQGKLPMAIIPQVQLFNWDDVEAKSDLTRFRYVLDTLPDEALMRELEEVRGKGRDDYPIRAVWNAILAGVVFGHQTIESLRRELLRNAELRQACGFDVTLGTDAVPKPWNFTRFLANLFRCQAAVGAMFDGLVDRLKDELPDLGRALAVDSKAIASAGKPKDRRARRDGRRERDADWGAKTYRGTDRDGKAWEKIRHWFGFKLHLIVDARHELPLAYEVTKASVNDGPMLLPMVERLDERHPEIVRDADHLSADKAYDSRDILEALHDRHAIKPLIDTRDDWKDGETTRPLFPDRADCVVYDRRGTVFCDRDRADRPAPESPMLFGGFEADRGTLKYLCPAARENSVCPRAESGACRYGRIVRVKLDTDRRYFVPLPRSTRKWTRLYAERSAVERVNSRLDVSFGFERHTIRGIAKMRCRAGIALAVMLAMALGAIRENRRDRMRSLVWSGSRERAADIRAAA